VALAILSLLLLLAWDRSICYAQSYGIANVERGVSPTTHKIVVGPNVQVSSSLPRAEQAEILASAHPSDSKRLIVCTIVRTQNLSDGWRSIVYASFNGGQTWELAFNPKLISESGSDPSCVIASDGTAYFSTLVPGNWTNVYSSEPDLRQWRFLQRINIVDRGYLTLDPTTRNRPFRLYVHGKSNIPALPPAPTDSVAAVYRLMGGSPIFEDPMLFAAGDSSKRLELGSGVVLPDGTLAVIARESKRDDPQAIGDIILVKLPKEANSYSNPSAIHLAHERECELAFFSSFPSLEIVRSPGPFQDRLYAVWTDASNGKCQVFVAYSINLGSTWSEPRAVPDESDGGALGRAASNAAIAVNSAGVLGVTWFSWKADLSREVRFAASFDGGVTFEPSVRVSTADNAYYLDKPFSLWAYGNDLGPTRPFLPEGRRRVNPKTLQIVIDGFLARGGETIGLVADATGVFHPVWNDNRTGVSQVWTASVHVDGRAMEAGDESFAGLQDVTKEFTISYSDARWDPTTKQVTVNASLKNDSNRSLQTPIKVRVIHIGDVGAQVIIMNADDGRTGAGAVWDFTSAFTGKGIPPGMSSQPKQLVFKISELPIIDRRSNTSYRGIPFIELSAVIYARSIEVR
jgi:hypothetical protein